jgi:hypothetical protein
MKKGLFVLVAVLLLVPSLTACSSAKTLDGTDRDNALAYTEPLADNLLNGYNAADYSVFSRDFNDAMKKGLTEQSFQTTLNTNVMVKLGKYVSRQITSVSDTGDYIVVLYDAKFELADHVTITFSVTKTEPHQVGGLYFTPAK